MTDSTPKPQIKRSTVNLAERGVSVALGKTLPSDGLPFWARKRKGGKSRSSSGGSRGNRSRRQSSRRGRYRAKSDQEYSYDSTEDFENDSIQGYSYEATVAEDFETDTIADKVAKGCREAVKTLFILIGITVFFIYIFSRGGSVATSDSSNNPSQTASSPRSTPQMQSYPASKHSPAPKPKPKPSARVRKVQLLLISLNFDPGPADGFYGKKTGQAIKQFQKKMGMPQTGKINNELLENLEFLTPDPKLR